ncbi:hypothetical protein [Longimicrobium sp.]|jgi:hypothetical protein|uniref:hypothetical protein n=1 Tax=Longimicrobium sp. TaxID=2029185 RepID=UPI002EDA0997
MKTGLIAIPFVLVALAACGGDGDEGQAPASSDTVSSTTVAPMPGADSAGMAVPGDTSHSSASNPTLQMAALGNSGITGTAQLMEHGANQTMVTVTLTGTGSGSHPGHIHSGTCDNLGAVVAPLQTVERANGNGTSTSTVEVPIATVMNGQHVVNFHAGAGDNPMAPVACAQIPAQAGGGTTQAM